MDNEGDIVLDSLPYIDGDLDIQKAETLILQEAAKFKRTAEEEEIAEYDLFMEHPALKSALQDAAVSKKLAGINFERFKLAEPTDKSLESWRTSVNNAKTQLEYQVDRSVNLELMSKFGANQWKIGNYELDQLNKGMRREVEELKLVLQRINKERKQEQILALRSIRQLQLKRKDLISRIIQVRMANSMLEKQY